METQTPQYERDGTSKVSTYRVVHVPQGDKETKLLVMPRQTNKTNSLREGALLLAGALVLPTNSRDHSLAVALNHLSVGDRTHKKADCLVYNPQTIGRLGLTNFVVFALNSFQEVESYSNTSNIHSMESLSAADYSTRGLSQSDNTTQVLEDARRISQKDSLAIDWLSKLVMNGFHYLMNSLVPGSMVSDKITTQQISIPFIQTTTLIQTVIQQIHTRTTTTITVAAVQPTT